MNYSRVLLVKLFKILWVHHNTTCHFKSCRGCAGWTIRKKTGPFSTTNRTLNVLFSLSFTNTNKSNICIDSAWQDKQQAILSKPPPSLPTIHTITGDRSTQARLLTLTESQAEKYFWGLKYCTLWYKCNRTKYRLYAGHSDPILDAPFLLQDHFKLVWWNGATYPSNS